MNLTPELMEVVIAENTYNPDKALTIARDFHGFYSNDSSLPALALPGGDLGDLISLYAASYSYGFEVDFDKAWETLMKLGEGNENKGFSYEAVQRPEMYRHLTYVLNDPQNYDLDEQAIALVKSHFSRLGVQVPVLDDKKLKREQALIIVTGNVAIWPQLTLTTPEGLKDIKLLIYHKTYSDYRRKTLAAELLNDKTVTLFEGLDEEYLYEVLSETMDNHLFVTVNHIDPKLPIFAASFDSKGKLAIAQLR